MIKVNLIKNIKKEKEKLSFAMQLSKLQKLKVEDLLKLDRSIYYISAILWIGSIASLIYYLKLSSDKSVINKSLNELQLKKIQLEAQRKDLLETEKRLQDSIKALQAKIEDIERSKDILIGLKSYYNPFISYLSLYTGRLPSNTWIYEYKQRLDINNGRIFTEINFASLDPSGIGSYGNLVKTHSSKYQITNIERKVGQHGFIFYFANLSSENSLIQENKP